MQVTPLKTREPHWPHDTELVHGQLRVYPTDPAMLLFDLAVYARRHGWNIAADQERYQFYLWRPNGPEAA